MELESLSLVDLKNLAKEKGIPYLHGAIHGTLGQLTTFLPDGERTHEEMFFDSELPDFFAEKLDELRKEME